MTDNMNHNNDDLLLQEFFSKARQQQITDNGFTESVMERVTAATSTDSANAMRLSRLWTYFCIFVGIVLFFVFRGWEAIRIAFEVFVHTAPIEYNLPALLLSFAVLCALGISEVFRREHITL